MVCILLIEPDGMLARTYRRALELDGHTVVACASAQAAIHASDEMRPELVVMELQLVSHSGVEFLYEFRSYVDWQDIPVIVLSHVPFGEFVGCRELLCEGLGVRSYLYKPQTTLRTLLRSVHELIPVR